MMDATAEKVIAEADEFMVRAREMVAAGKLEPGAAEAADRQLLRRAIVMGYTAAQQGMPLADVVAEFDKVFQP